MKMGMNMTITPKFTAREVMIPLYKDWNSFKAFTMKLGMNIHNYMQNYINARRHRRGGTGNLANAINFVDLSTPKTIGWGIGDINLLQKKAPYWYVINYGKKITGEPFIPGGGKFVPGSFEGHASEGALAGGVEKFNYKDGSKMGIKPKSVIRPIDYIDSTWIMFNKQIAVLLASFK